MSFAQGSVAARTRALIWGETKNIPIPCDDDSGRAQVSVSWDLCRDEAFEKHKVECVGIEILRTKHHQDGGPAHIILSTAQTRCARSALASNKPSGYRRMVRKKSSPIKGTYRKLVVPTGIGRPGMRRGREQHRPRRSARETRARRRWQTRRPRSARSEWPVALGAFRGRLQQLPLGARAMRSH